MKTLVNFLPAMLVFTLTTGCATSNRAENETFSIESNPTGATATLSTGESCITPCSIERPLSEDFRVTVTKTGFKPVTTTIRSTKTRVGGRPATAAVRVGGILNVPLGPQSGSSYSLEPNPLMVDLDVR